MAKTNKLQPKNAAVKSPAAKSTTSKSVSSKAKPTKVVAKSTKASPVSKSSSTKKSARPVNTNPAKATAAKIPPKAASPAKAASKSPAKVNTVAVKIAAKPAVTKAPVAKPAADKAPPKAALDKAALDQSTPTVKAAVAPRPPVVTAAQSQRAMPANGSKTASASISSPVTTPVAASRPVQAAVTSQAKPVPPATVQAVVDPNAPKKLITTRHGFKTNELIVYPAHGVGRIIGIEEQEIAGISLELFVIEFEKDKMTLRVPTSKLVSVGMRKLAEEGVLKRAMETLKGKARIKRTMWSRRAQEYEAKINSGDLVSIAEVVRDLYRSEAQPEQSYSERQLYEAALDRMSRELAAVDKSDERSAMQRITEILSKSAKGRRAVEEEAQAAAAGQGDVKAA